MIKSIVRSIVSLTLLISFAGVAGADEVFRLPLSNVKWEPIPGMPKGFFTGVLHENPSTKAQDMFFKTPVNGVVPRHWHTANEVLMIVKGTFHLSGTDGKGTDLMPGGYAYIPAKTVHVAVCKGKSACLVYVSSDGAFDMNVVDEKGNPVKP
jgi:quercetin dioxygenase-like cupin family protein